MHPARPSSSTTAVSVVWALAPLFSCGFATPFTIGYAAHRRRSPALALAAAMYLVALVVMFAIIVAYDSSDTYPDWAGLLVVVGLFSNWIGGLIHSLAIRSAVFAPRVPGPAPFVPGPQRHHPAPQGTHPSPHNQRAPYPAGPYPPHAAPVPPSDASARYPAQPRPGWSPHQPQPHAAHRAEPGHHHQRGTEGPYTPRGAEAPYPPAHGAPQGLGRQRPEPAAQAQQWPGQAAPARPEAQAVSHPQSYAQPQPPQGRSHTQPRHRAPDGRTPGPRDAGDHASGDHDGRVPRRTDPPATSTNPPAPAGATYDGTGTPVSTSTPGGRSGASGRREVSTLPTQQPGPLPPGEPDRIGPYRLIGSLGQGGQGAVYLAETPNGTPVAIKVLHARLATETGAQQRFLREVEAARRVAPFSTARVIDADVADERLFIVSEYVEGASLEQLVRDRGPRGHDALVRLALSTAGALAAIHRAGIVHRDFKPSNVLIGADGPRVVDFGIARVLDNATATGSGVLGTPAYMSPEQVSGEKVGPESDVFSWAGTMVYAATGRPAFGEDNIAAVFHRIFTKQPDLSALPASLARVVDRCLEKRPENRPTASDVMLAIVN
ncbi:hypothetical protein Sme01_22070 [Sphaerisporangium melleum]|uniref:non-specific serine/threonine protein kinase n=1 Tax=Sphaerisporangium melleum TaxID=321316 RepID=A0A917R066_9ACTN|nr:serine/threonine-protein kinase [Sphaerisporangium melleum]GGK79211.1 hypothetical protein GCM10007964_22310 [Sphaerisporangium melleum]GII69731.1 hypothetical protein Sme01_22070 [Sphaerisporangium melleum]